MIVPDCSICVVYKQIPLWPFIQLWLILPSGHTIKDYYYHWILLFVVHPSPSDLWQLNFYWLIKVMWPHFGRNGHLESIETKKKMKCYISIGWYKLCDHSFGRKHPSWHCTPLCAFVMKFSMVYNKIHHVHEPITSSLCGNYRIKEQTPSMRDSFQQEILRNKITKKCLRRRQQMWHVSWPLQPSFSIV